MLQIWELPDTIIFHVLGFVAPPTHRAQVVCHQLAPLCHQARNLLLEEQRSVALWDTLLKEDYGKVVCNPNHNPTTSRSGLKNNNGVERRVCKRLRRSPIHRVRDAHQLMKDNTEIAYYYLTEMTNASKGDKKAELTKRGLCGLLNEFGPHLRINTTLSSGGLYLVEVCRARHVRESVVLKCVQELVEERGAIADLFTSEAPNSSLTALCVAAVRAMPTVVKYLLCTARASRDIRSSGRFRLMAQPKKSLRCNNVTPLEFAQKMRQAEIEAGASARDLVNLNKCIRLLDRSS